MLPRLLAGAFLALSLTPLLRAGPESRADPQAKTNSLNLEGLLALALENDGRVRAAHAKLDAYRARYDHARWAWFPRIKLNALLGGPVGERRLKCPERGDCVELRSADDTGLGDFSEQVSFAIGGKLEAVMPLYTFGKLSGAERAAEAGVEAGRADIARARQAVALEVRRAWYGWLLASAAVEILEDGVQKLKQAEKKLDELLEALNEDVTLRDRFKLRYHTAEVNGMLSKASQGKQVALAGLCFLTGFEELGTRPALAEAELERPRLELAAREVYLQRAERLRPEWRMLNAAYQAAQAAADVRRAAFYPDLFIAGRLEGSYSPAHDFIDNSLLNRGLTYYTGGLALGLQVTLDIPQKLAQLEQAQAEQRRIDIQRQQARRALGLEIDARLAELKAAQAQYKAAHKGHRAAKAWMRSNVMSYGVGLADTKDLLESLAAYAKSRLQRNQAIYDILSARDRLDASVGEDLGKPR